MAKGLFTGRRIADGDFFQHSEPEPGDYGRVMVTGQGWKWFTCLPNGAVGRLHDNHKVEENEDGTITVTASIEHNGRVYVSKPLQGGGPISDPSSYWHGHLVDGVWIEA